MLFRSDAAWVADGQISDHWLPFSPVTGRLDAFEWKVPTMLLSGVAPDIDADTFNRIIEAEPVKTETTKADIAILEPVAATITDETETLDAEAAMRSAGFKPAAEALNGKKKSGFRLF